MLGSYSKLALVIAGVSGVTLSAHSLAPQVQTQPSAGQSWPPRGMATQPLSQQTGPQPTGPIVQPLPAYASDPLTRDINEWKRLQQSDNYSFAEYANFLLAHPGWPGEVSRRSAAETMLGSGATNAALVVRFFGRFPPLTAAGHIRHAEALLATGQQTQAQAAARAAWRKGSLRVADEARLLGGFPGAIGPADHDARMDMLLWQGATSAGDRQLALVSPSKRALFAARLAFRKRSPEAAIFAAQVSQSDRQDPGYIADRATWLRASNQSPAARTYLAQPRRLSALPGRVEDWYEVLLQQAQGAAADRQYGTAYDIARQIDDAYPAGTDVSTRPYGERDDYTSLAWLAGQTAMRRLNRPRDAIGMYERYGMASQTPQTRSKGLYWAGRAAEAAGDRTAAQGFYQRAAVFPDLYYGQLSLERLGQPIRRLPAPPTAASVNPGVRAAFQNREVVRAARSLGQMNRAADQGLFLRQIAADATTAEDHILAADLGQSIGRPDLGVMVGRSASTNGHYTQAAFGFPSVAVPGSQASNWTMIHAIARQESQFDRAAVSRVGARGLMQLMPATAREQSGKIGLSYNPESLTSDPSYNIQLGSTYFQRMLSYYGDSYPLAIAAYNAGAGNVNKWLRANGDPRTGAVDWLDWVEDIPYFETKNYVQRVLENAVVYDLMHPDKARSRGPTNLSWYMGKRTPG
ncbi:lytic transglycosylase domain-containing protein [Sphingomonas sp. 37zxx]|uniref:lytic transglycosylase domain-containing protein n=1 Tax=Sphingomonas sp. 37zxx TaxID=1550073 RepID=UPI00053BFDF2